MKYGRVWREKAGHFVAVVIDTDTWAKDRGIVTRPDAGAHEWACSCGRGDSREARWCDHIVAVLVALGYREPRGVEYGERLRGGVRWVRDKPGDRRTFLSTVVVGGLLVITSALYFWGDARWPASQRAANFLFVVAAYAGFLWWDYRAWKRGDAWREEMRRGDEDGRGDAPGG